MRRNTEWFYFKGKGSWAKLFDPDMTYGEWQIQVHLSPESVDLFNKLKEGSADFDGIKNELKEDEDGYYHTFRRKLKKEYQDRNGTNQEIIFPPPIVVDANGNPWDRRVLIGNGSDVTVKVERYVYNIKFRKGQKGSAIRLVSVMIDKLVPYDKESFTEGQNKQVQGLTEQPAHRW